MTEDSTILDLSSQRQEMESGLRDIALLLKDRADALEAIGMNTLSAELRHSSKTIWKAAEDSQRISMEELSLRIQDHEEMNSAILTACVTGGKELQ
jgi:hypothetical protein